MYIWSNLPTHENIVKFEGFIMDQKLPSIVSRWAVGGTVNEYLSKNHQNPDLNLKRLVSKFCDVSPKNKTFNITR